MCVRFLLFLFFFLLLLLPFPVMEGTWLCVSREKKQRKKRKEDNWGVPGSNWRPQDYSSEFRGSHCEDSDYETYALTNCANAPVLLACGGHFCLFKGICFGLCKIRQVSHEKHTGYDTTHKRNFSLSIFPLSSFAALLVFFCDHVWCHPPRSSQGE